MAPKLRYDMVNMVLAEPNPYLRRAVRQALSTQGLTNVVECSDQEAVEQEILVGRLDVLISDVELKGGDFCDMVHRLRHHRLGPNPFLVVLATTDAPSVELVRRVINSGVDDLLIKPIGVDKVMERIGLLAKGRKPFVVTHDYIGPDRRKADRDDDRTPTDRIDVPNTLFSKVKGEGDAAALQALIDQAAAGLNQAKMQRYSVQVGYLVDRIVNSYAQGKWSDILWEDCDRLLYVGEDLSRRLRGTGYAHVGELALTLTNLVSRFKGAGVKPAPVDIELLSKLSLAIGRAFSPEQDTAEVAAKISATVSDFTRTHGTPTGKPPAS